MAFSWQESVKPAGTRDIQCDIEYLDKSYIHVYLDGSETTAFTWTSSTNIRLNSPLSAETVVLLIRKTAREYLYIEFASGAPFIEGNVDTQNTQLLHLAQELVEGRYIEGFYGDINMHRYRITNLGDPVGARDATNKQYVDAGDARLDRRIDAERAAWVAAVDNEASIRKAADDALDVRTTNLEQTFYNANTNSFPWWTVLTTDTDTVTPGMAFTKAKVRVNGVTQTAGYSYSINAGVVKFAEVLPAGTLVDMTIGVDSDVDTGVVASVLGLLSAPDGASFIGEATYAQVRAYSGDATYLRVGGYSTKGDGGQGEFDRIVDSTAPDDDCVHLHDALGRVWRRRMGTGNVIRMAWAGAKSTFQSPAPQDAAFRNCLKAAATLSGIGYPQSIIAGLDFGFVRIGAQHHIRCGTFPESLSWKYPASGAGNRFGIDGQFCFDEGAGFFVVQANHPLFRMTVDNTRVAFNTENYTDEQIAVLVQNNWILRLESMVNAPELDLQVGNYPGTVLYSKGKLQYSDVTAIWPDLTSTLPSIQNFGKVAINIKTCGRDFYLNNTGAGLGHMHSVWTQNNSQPGQFNSCYDLTLTFEDYVPHTETRGGLIFNACGTLSLENILVGAGGVGHVAFWDCRNVSMNREIGICGNTLWSNSNTADDLYSMEICNSEVTIGAAHAQNAGKYMRVGFNSQVTIQHMTCWNLTKLCEMTNDLSKLKYRGQRAGFTGDPSRVYFNGGFAQNLNAASVGAPPEPVITIDATVGGDFELHYNLWTNNVHAGYEAADEAKLAIIESLSTSATGEVSIGPSAKLEGNATNYVIRLANKAQLKAVDTRKTSFCRVRYTEDGSQSSFAMREASHPNGTTVIPIDGSTFAYAQRRPGKYFVSIVIPPGGGSCSVNKNGFPVFQTTAVGTHNVNLDLKYQEQVTFATSNVAAPATAQWRYTLEK